MHKYTFFRFMKILQCNVVWSKETVCKAPYFRDYRQGQLLQIIISALPWRPLGVRSLCCSLEGCGWCVPRLRSLGHWAFGLKHEICNKPLVLAPQPVSWTELSFSYWGSKVQGWSLVFFHLPGLKWLIKMKRDCLLSAFWQPWQDCSSNLITFWFLPSPIILFPTFQRIN